MLLQQGIELFNSTLSWVGHSNVYTNGLGIGGQFQIRLSDRVNTEWFADYWFFVNFGEGHPERNKIDEEPDTPEINTNQIVKSRNSTATGLSAKTFAYSGAVKRISAIVLFMAKARKKCN